MPDLASNFPDTAPPVGVVMGSQSDWETMRASVVSLAELRIPAEAFVVSAHRTPDRMVQYARSAAGRGVQIIIAGAGGAAHLPGMIAGETPLPVIGVPVQSRALSGWDSLLSIAQMPGGVPVATMSIGTSGARNAGLLAARILALSDAELAGRLKDFVRQQSERVVASGDLREAVQAIYQQHDAERNDL